MNMESPAARCFQFHHPPAEASKSYFGRPPCETIVAGDINGDCEIDFEDFRLMALHWCEDNTRESPRIERRFGYLSIPP